MKTFNGPSPGPHISCSCGRSAGLQPAFTALLSQAGCKPALHSVSLLLVLVCATLLSAQPARAQFSQQGPKLVGTGAVGNAGQGVSVSLSADGNTAIVGGPSDNSNAGAAWVWTRSGGVWTQQGTKLVGSEGFGVASQGSSVSLSADGNTAIVGGPGPPVGAAWVWTRSGGVWTQQGGKLVASDASVMPVLGSSVSLSADGNTAIVGGPNDNFLAGAAWVWTRSGGVWTQQGTKLVGSGAVGTNAQQGISVSLSADGNTAIVGGRGDNSFVGAAWVWTRSGGVWTQQGTKLAGSGAVGNARQGYSVCLSADGNTAIVGGVNDNGFVGAAWVWTRSGGVWTQQGAKLVGSGAQGSFLLQGASVSLSGDGNTAIIGGIPDNGAGAAWVWTRSGGVWTQQGTKLVGSGAVGIASQGISVSLSDDGNTAIVGGDNDNFSAGSAWVFTNSTPSVPAITTQPVSQSIQAGSNVSFSVTASGTAPLNYQWRFSGQKLAGQTALSLSLTNVQFANAGGYSVIVTNAYGSVTSAVAQLTVFTNLVVTQTNRAPTTNEIGQPTIPTDTNHFKVYTNGMFKSGVALNPNKMTVVLTHGWRGNPNDWAAYTAQIIQQRIGVNAVNIVAWDWSRSNEAGTVFSISGLQLAAMRTQGQGVFLGKNLITALGSNYSQRIHFLGHSLGTLVNAAAANYVHTNGFSWSNTQMTLCDEAEAAWVLESSGWQMATTLPEIIQQGVSTLQTFDGNFSTPQPGWAHPLPNKYAWADNYISLVGLLHAGAANVILTYTYPSSLPDVSTVIQEFYNFHDYSHYFYEDTIEPGIFNTGGQTNATYAGFLCSFEGGGSPGRPAANTYFYQNPSGLELNLVQKDLAFATNFLNARFKIYQLIGISSGLSQFGNQLFGSVAQAVGQVTGQIVSAGQNLNNMVLNFLTSISGGPAPKGGGTGNTPAYAWVPLNVPSNALSMSFDFMLQGNGNNDSFQVALNGTNVMSLETSLIQTNVLLNSGMIDVSQYAGQQVTLFMGIVGGTSTNAALTVSNFQFYVVLPPSLQIQLAGTNVVVTWPLSAAGYVLQSANKLTPPVSWTTVTNVPVIVNFQYTVTNQISSGSRFYRLAIVAAPALQARVSGKNFILSWPTNAIGYVLQTTTNLTAANSWTAVTNMPATVNQQSVVTNQISGAARFYRLKQQ